MKVKLFLLCAMMLLTCLFGVGCQGENTPKSMGRYEITAEYNPDNGTLAGVEKFTFENGTQTALSVLKFQLYPNAYRKDALYAPVDTSLKEAAYYSGESYGEMVIYSVHGAKSWEVMGEDENILYVYLLQPLYPDETVVLDIGFMVKLAKVNHRTGVTSRTVNLGNFYPILCPIGREGFVETVYHSLGEPFVSEIASYSVSITLPKEYEVACSGSLVAERTLESKKVHTYAVDNVRDFALVLCTGYKRLQTQVGDCTLSYYYYDDRTAEQTLQTAREALEFFSLRFGEYPYSTYAVAQTELCFDGEEYPCFTLLSHGLTESEKIRAIVRETANQWWYGVVGSDQVQNAWQDEGLAEYSALLFFENYEKYERTREQIVQEALKEYRSYYDVYGSVLGRTDTRMSRCLNEFISRYEYLCTVRDKSVIMFDTLRKSVGDKTFFAALKRYYNENKYKLVSPEHLIGAFERAGVDAGGYFESFLNGKVVL